MYQQQKSLKESKEEKDYYSEWILSEFGSIIYNTGLLFLMFKHTFMQDINIA